MPRRRAIAAGVASDEPTLDIYSSDYLRSQLADLRKFFDRDPRVHKLGELTACLQETSVSKNKHKELLDTWQRDYEDLANKFFFHRERGYIPPTGVPTSALDVFIDETDNFLTVLVHELTAAGYSIEYIVRDKEYFDNIESDASNFFKSI